MTKHGDVTRPLWLFPLHVNHSFSPLTLALRSRVLNCKVRLLWYLTPNAWLNIALYRWNEERGFNSIRTREKQMVYCFYVAVCILPAPEQSMARTVWAKLAMLNVLIDDFFDSPSESYTDKVQFLEAFRSWVQHFPSVRWAIRVVRVDLARVISSDDHPRPQNLSHILMEFMEIDTKSVLSVVMNLPEGIRIWWTARAAKQSFSSSQFTTPSPRSQQKEAYSKVGI